MRVVASVPLEEGPQIVYPLARIARETPHPLAEAFVAALLEPAATAVFQRHGFRVLNPTAADPPAASPETP